MVNEALVEAAGASRQASLEDKERKLESIGQQNRLIELERLASEAEKKMLAKEAARLLQDEIEASQAQLPDEVWAIPAKGTAAVPQNGNGKKREDEDKKKWEDEDDLDMSAVSERLEVAELLADMSRESALLREKKELEEIKAQVQKQVEEVKVEKRGHTRA